MKKIILVNGSPRKNGNTAQLLKSAAIGAQDAGAEVTTINLYALNFKGCTSCFYCKLKSKEHGTCAMKDDLSPILEEIKLADAIIFGSPIYFMNLSSGMIAFIERLIFSNYIYSTEIPTVFPKKLPSAFFYTMNMTKDHWEQFNMEHLAGMYERFSENVLGVKPKRLLAFDTLQFKDYSKYESSIFDEQHKIEYRKKFWQTQLDDAYKIGRELVIS
ncbi:MAG: flavodoxin family protein [Selenomonadaceae bacterium]|nr:flavodoxin family protein [Selenomonadaceae bacterium]